MRTHGTHVRRRLRGVVLVVLALAAPPSAGRAREPGAFGNIYNGTPTGEFPSVVGLGIVNRNGSGLICTGTLITPSAVLTAAHCLAFDPVAAIAVAFADGVTRADYDVAAFIPHPRYTLARASVADIGIVLLARPITDVAPMPLAARSPRPRATGTIVGFGEDGRGTIGRKQVGTVRLRRCPRAVRVRGGKVRLTKTLCWRPRDQTNDTCSGDSGGPLIVDGAVAGVTSGGIRAGGGSCPSLLSYDTNVARYRAWIASVVGP